MWSVILSYSTIAVHRRYLWGQMCSLVVKVLHVSYSIWTHVNISLYEQWTIYARLEIIVTYAHYS